MITSPRGVARTSLVAIRATVLLTVLLGIGYTFLVTGIGQLLLPAQANGSAVRDADGDLVGSSLIGQSFTDSAGEPLPQFFQSRPSAAGDGYDGSASSGSNLGPENPDLVAAIEERKAAIAEFNGAPESAVPADAVTASASGLDPHISTEYAVLQVPRVAAARELDESTVRAVIAEHTTDPALGYLGEASVNVLEVNLALEELED